MGKKNEGAGDRKGVGHPWGQGEDPWDEEGVVEGADPWDQEDLQKVGVGHTLACCGNEYIKYNTVTHTCILYMYYTCILGVVVWMAWVGEALYGRG